jgi:ABC-type lipoprotein release transport system permease subunit
VPHPDFLTEREPQMASPAAELILGELNRDPRIQSAAGRTLVDGMIQSPLTTAGVQIRGFSDSMERKTTTFHENIMEGAFPGTGIRNPILIGEKLSEKIKTDIGNRVVLTFQDIENELTSASFTVSGTFKTSSAPYDEANVFVQSEDLSDLMADSTIYHEIGVMLVQEETAERLAEELNNKYNGIIAETWYELSPELRYLTDFGSSMTLYVMIVIMLALAFGILNTMLMAIFERMKELGMLMSVGMSKMRVFFMIMIEAVILSFTGAAIGMGVAWGSVVLMAENGLDLSGVGGDSLAEFGYDAVIYPVVTSTDFITTAILVIVTAILAAIYPSIKALRMNPGEIIRQ